MRLNWGMTLVIGLGIIILVVGWQGTHNQVWSIFTLTNPAAVTQYKCPPNAYISTTGKCPGQCTIDTVAGQVCLPKV